MLSYIDLWVYVECDYQQQRPPGNPLATNGSSQRPFQWDIYLRMLRGIWHL